MIELFEHERMESAKHSSKGNQLKWNSGSIWYKADYTGYEGLAEYMVSHLLLFSSLEPDEYVLYDTEQIQYKEQLYTGCKSQDFLQNEPDAGKECRQIITLERLYHNFCGESLYKNIYRFPDYEDRLKFIVEQAKQMTGLTDFGAYMCKLLTIDAFFLNEDRHTHNIAVIWDGKDGYDYCPFFDQGAALLADTAMDYPLGQDIIELIPHAAAKTFCSSFEEQLDTAEKLYGEALFFSFGEKEIQDLLNREQIYPENIRHRVYDILLQQCRKYQWLLK